MAINVDRFVTKEQDFGGLYNLSDNIRKQDAIAQQRQIREQERSQQMAAKRAATGKFLMDYLDPNDHLTGTNYDPQIVMGFQDLLAEGADLANKGADTNMLMMALAPKVKKLTEYSTKAKLVNDRLKSQLQQLKPNMGYDLGKLEQEARRAAFYDEQGQLKDISTVDPNTDWLTETIRMSPEKVTTDAGIDEFVKNSQKFENTRDVTRYTPTGGMQRSKVKITSPNWLIPDVDEKGAMTGLVPKYQIAVDGGQPVMHEFKDEKGVSKFAPVRVLDEGEYRSLLAGNPGIADWLRGQVKSAIGQYKTADGQPIDMNSPQAENVARAILYDELKRRKPGGITDVEVSKPTQIRVSTGGSGSGSASGVNVNDIYKRIDDEVTRLKDYGERRTPGNLLDGDAQSVILDFVNKGRGENDKLLIEDIRIEKSDKGDLLVFDTDGNLKTTLPKIGTNLKVQPSVKEKRAVIEAGKATTRKPKNDPLGLF